MLIIEEVVGMLGAGSRKKIPLDFSVNLKVLLKSLLRLKIIKKTHLFTNALTTVLGRGSISLLP
jgi:hypothetical protein